MVRLRTWTLYSVLTRVNACSFVHGIMDGEVVEDVEKGIRFFQPLSIR